MEMFVRSNGCEAEQQRVTNAKLYEANAQSPLTLARTEMKLTCARRVLHLSIIVFRGNFVRASERR